MALFKKRPKTAQQKAQGAQMRVVARLACCAYIIFYVIIPLLRDTGAEGMNPTVRVIVIAAFIAITAVILAVTGLEIVRNWKAGLYKASSYTDDDIFMGSSHSAETGDEEDAGEDGEDENGEDEDKDEDTGEADAVTNDGEDGDGEEATEEAGDQS